MRSTLSVLILILLSISLGYSQTHELNKTFIEELENKKIDANQVRELKIKATNYKEDIAQTIPEGYQKLKLLSELKNLEKLDFQSLTLGYNVDTIITFDPETFDQIIKIQKNHSSWSPYIILPTLEQLTQLKELHMDFGDVSSLVKNPNKDLINDPDLNRHLNDIYWTIHSQNTEKELNEALKACLDEKGITPKRKTDLWNWIYLYDYLKAEENGSAKPTSIPYLNCFLDLIETNNEWKSYAYLRGVLAYLQHPASSIETLISTNIPPEILNTIQANNEEHFTQLKRDQKIYKDTKKMFLQKAHSTLFKNDIKLCEQWFLEILPKLKNLEVLSIKNNYSMEIEPLIDALKGLKKLKTLKIQSCRIEALPKEIKKLKKLELLDLSDNALSINSKKLNSLNIKQLNTTGNPFIDLVVNQATNESFDQYVILNQNAEMYVWFSQKMLKENNKNFKVEGLLSTPCLTLKAGKLHYVYNNNDVYFENAEYIQFYNSNYNPVQSRIEVKEGVFIVDAPSNRLGLLVHSIPYLPSVEILSKSKVYYEENNAWGKEAYPKSSFHISIEPFIIDSLWQPLNNYPIVDCQLHSSICEPLQGKLKLMKDNSLGMTYLSKKSLRVYEKKYQNPYLLFEGTLTMSNQGLWGKGSFMHKSWAVSSDEILFLNDNFYIKNPTSSTGTFPKDAKKDLWWMYDLEAKKWVQKEPAK